MDKNDMIYNDQWKGFEPILFDEWINLVEDCMMKDGDSESNLETF